MKNEANVRGNSKGRMKVVGAAVVIFSQTFPYQKQKHDAVAFISWLLMAKHESIIHHRSMDGAGKDLDCFRSLLWSSFVM